MRYHFEQKVFIKIKFFFLWICHSVREKFTFIVIQFVFALLHCFTNKTRTVAIMFVCKWRHYNSHLYLRSKITFKVHFFLHNYLLHVLLCCCSQHTFICTYVCIYQVQYLSHTRTTRRDEKNYFEILPINASTTVASWASIAAPLSDKNCSKQQSAVNS